MVTPLRGARTLELEKQLGQPVLPTTAQTIGFTQTRTITTTAATIAMLHQTSQLEQQPVPETCTGIQTPTKPQATSSHFQSHSTPIQTSTHPITRKTYIPMRVDYRRLNKLPPEVTKVDIGKGCISLIPLSKIDELYAKLKGCKVCSSLQ